MPRARHGRFSGVLVPRGAAFRDDWEFRRQNRFRRYESLTYNEAGTGARMGEDKMAENGAFSGKVQSYAGSGDIRRTRHRDLTNPKRKRGPGYPRLRFGLVCAAVTPC